ncbi:DUF423 domain-containing protein [Pallidibacillus pasinlerensis]|uniref:DUF423 domain-containing protein n=1 Tax=Pallidibacillus pasinlerensis TaxID=2703818 RepID=A0ABX0A188_9BACI|nr:DUF423 domain-containing protein [Pallidibacillus pasinlerensis]NCU16344.1 DUF423 domain-containing protein [Pallidibacillus pasinlerensis]
MNIFLFLGALNGFIAVALGGFGAHGLEQILDASSISTWQTGVRYEMLHAVALVAVGILKDKYPNSSLLNWAGWLFLIGIICFSGSLYIMAPTDINLGLVTPFGGVLFLTAWTLLMVASFKLKK